jgi:hypothetical protein
VLKRAAAKGISKGTAEAALAKQQEEAEVIDFKTGEKKAVKSKRKSTPRTTRTKKETPLRDVAREAYLWFQR